MKSRIVILAAPILLTVLAHFGLPLPSTDPLRSTLVLLPLVVAALFGMQLWAEARGGRPTPPTVVAGESIALLALAWLILARDRLGLGSDQLVDRCFMGGLVLFLMHRLAWLIPALRQALGSELPKWPPAPFFALPFVTYLTILPWTVSHRPPDGDAPHYLLVTHSLAYDFDADLTNNYRAGDSLAFMDRRLEPQPGDPVGRAGELYSRHNIVLPLVLAPAYRVEGLLGVLVLMAAITAATCWLTLSLAGEYFRRQVGGAVFAWAVLAFTAPVVLFSYQVWVEIPAALLVITAVLQIRRIAGPEPSSWRQWIALAASVLFLPLLKIRFLLVAMPLLALAIWRGGPRARRGAALILLALATVTAATLLFNQARFENPLKYHDIDGLQAYSQPLAKYLQGGVGLFFDCAFGLFATAPVWMLLLPAAWLLLRRREPIWIDTCIIILPYLLALSPRGEWFGAWSPPFRYGIVMLPLLSLWLIPLVAPPLRQTGRMLLSMLAVPTLAVTLLWVVVPGWTYNFAHGRSHLLDLLSSQIDADVARFFASTIRMRVASYLWPPLALLATCGLWFAGRRTGSWKAVAWGVSGALLLPAIAVLAAEHRATRVVEFEDAWLAPKGGRLYPPLWVVYRPQFRGAWVLPAGKSVRIPVVSGGDRFDLRLDLMLRPEANPRVTLVVSDGRGRDLATTRLPTSPRWAPVVFEDLPWDGVAPLIVGTRPPGKGSHRGHEVYVDRALLSWR